MLFILVGEVIRGMKKARIYVMPAFFMFWINLKQIQKRNRLAFFDRLLLIQG